MTKFYHQGASGPEEWVLVPAEGMSTDAQVEEALKAYRTAPSNSPQDSMRAALAAAQAAGAQGEADLKMFNDTLAVASHEAGFAAGIEAAAKWAELHQLHTGTDMAAYAADIRALRPPAAPAKHTDRSVPCPTCGFVIRTVERRPLVIEDDLPPSASAPAGAPSEEEIAQAWFGTKFLGDTKMDWMPNAQRVLALLQDGKK